MAAVVVTRDRLALLRRCLESLGAQTRALDAIYVVDVASSDETPTFLASQPAPFQIVRLETNAGGAGGFHAGIERTFEDGFDWIWLMDDDGYAAPDALEKLLRVTEDKGEDSRITSQDREARWLNSLVVQINDPAQLAFDFPVNGHFLRKSTEEMQAGGLCIEDCCPFNGTMIHRSVVERVGSPNPAFFIWGDEQEYKRRAQQAGIRAITVTDSLFYHPASNAPNLPTVPLRSFWKHFYHVRNHGASATKEGQVRLSRSGSLRLGRFYLRTLLISILSNSVKILIVIAALLAAFTNNTKKPYPK